VNNCTGNGSEEPARAAANAQLAQNPSTQNDKTVCLNTAVNNAGHGFANGEGLGGGLGAQPSQG
jgi:hypothetical protein